MFAHITTADVIHWLEIGGYQAGATADELYAATQSGPTVFPLGG